MCNKINITPKLTIEGEDRTLGAVLLGAPYSRKRESVMLPMIQQDIQSKPMMGVAVFDTDGIPTQAAARCARESGRPYVLLDPRMEWCPFFNPLIGDENEVFEDLRTVVSEYLPDLSPSLRALNESLLSNAIKVLKRLDKAEGVNGRYATFINMNTVLQNPSQDGRKLVIRFGQLKGETDAEQKENSDIASWFINEYYAERSKPFEQTACLRLLLGKLISEPHLRTVLNPDFDKGQVSEVDFDRLVSDNCIICVSAAKPTLGSLSRFFRPAGSAQIPAADAPHGRTPAGAGAVCGRVSGVCGARAGGSVHLCLPQQAGRHHLAPILEPGGPGWHTL